MLSKDLLLGIDAMAGKKRKRSEIIEAILRDYFRKLEESKTVSKITSSNE